MLIPIVKLYKLNYNKWKKSFATNVEMYISVKE